MNVLQKTMVYLFLKRDLAIKLSFYSFNKNFRIIFKMKALTSKEVNIKIAEVDSWKVISGSLQKEFEFVNFVKAIEFINQIAEVAEEQEHHPVITNSYNYLKIELKTHDVNGISNKDFKLAKTIDNLS